MKSHLSGFAVFGPDATPPQQHIFELYHENSKLRPGIAPPRPEVFAAPQSKPRSVKPNRYPHAQVFRLPSFDDADWISLSWLGLISKRRSYRQFETRALPLTSLAAILHSAYGVTRASPNIAANDHERRHSPSAGALFPLEIYAALNYTDTPPPGLYHYSSGDHALAQLAALDPAKVLQRSCLDGATIGSAPLILIIAAAFGQTTAKYGDRGYRYILLEAGHVAQTITLAAVSLGLATLPIGGFNDDKINAWIGLDGVNEAVCYMIGIGEPVT